MGDAWRWRVKISDLGWAVGTDVGIGRRSQRRGRRCSRSCHLGIVRRILRCRIDAQMDVVVAAFDGCRRLDLAPALPLAPFALLHLLQDVLLPLRLCPTFLHMAAMFSDPLVFVVVALFVFITVHRSSSPSTVPDAECSFPCRACRRHPNSDSPLSP